MPEKSGPRRPFATGSKPGPDAVDHYLEEKGFYRKHVARDASSLFRVVSEQIFDIQNYHEKTRQDCAAYMETRAKEYANEVDKNFYNYISLLRRYRTHGTLLELRVLAKMYRKNVILFEPTQNLQTTSHVYVQNDSYDNENPLRVFYSQKDKHFDVIYTMDYVERLAECQAIVYNILYTNVFKLPDVQYAVERMLHDQEEQMTLPLSDDPSLYKTQAGEIVSFDCHSKTNCVLKDPKTCHFHNQVDFYEVFDENKDAITVINRTDETGGLKIYKLTDGFLHDMEKSCVRQLLDERITPFPYKVAKALDPSIYRNTEFELWSENRKEQRMKWLDSAEFPMKHSMDDKWFMYDSEKYRRNGLYGMRKFSDNKFEHAVVDESSYLALDDEMKKKYVILDPSAEPFKFSSFSNFDHFIPSKDSLELTVMPVGGFPNRGGYKKRGGGRYSNNSYQNNYQHNSGQHHYNSGQHHYNSGSNNSQQQMTHVSEVERDNQFQESQDTQGVFQQQCQQEGTCQESYSYEQQLSQGQSQVYQPMAPQSWNGQMVQYIAPQYQPMPGQPAIHYAGSLNYQQIMPYGNFSIPPPPATVVNNPSPSMQESGDVMNIMRESELASAMINWKPKESVDNGGADLPLSEVPTLQFYYNLGVRYFLATGVQRRLESVASQLESLDINDNLTAMQPPNAEKSNDHQSKTELPPVPTNTPVTTKCIGGNYGPPGKSYHNNQHGRNMRPFPGNRENNNRDNSRDNRDGSYRNNWNHGNNQRKEIKFNSNVKNLHKNEAKVGGHVQTQTFHSSGSLGQFSSNINATSSTVSSNQDKLSPTNGSQVSIPQFSPISPILQEPPAQTKFQHQSQVVQEPVQLQPQQQFYQPYPPQQAFVTPQQQGVTMVYQMTDDGYMMQQVPQPMPYTPQYQYPIQPQPMYYQTINYQHQQQVMDGTLSSNDSGMVDPNVFPQGYQQPQLQYYQPSPVPVYYAPTPLPQTPQMAQVAPVFPVPVGQVQATQSLGNLTKIPVAPLTSQSSASTIVCSSTATEENSSGENVV